MSNLSDLLPAGAGAKSATFTASGTISSGQTVALNSDGTVKEISATAIPETLGSATALSSPSSLDTVYVSAYDSANNAIVVPFRDPSDSYKGKAVVFTQSGTTTSVGTPVTFTSSTIYLAFGIVYDSNAGKVAIMYSDITNSSYIYCVVGTVSGASISFGTPVVAYSSGVSWGDQTGDDNVGAVFDSANNKVVFTFRDSSDQPRSIVGTISGTSISFGTSNLVNGQNSGQIASAYDVSAGKVIIAVDNNITNTGELFTGTVSGTSISHGNQTQFNSTASDAIGLAYVADQNLSVLVFRDVSASSVGVAKTVSFDGSSFTQGTEVNYGGSGAKEWNRVAYDSSAGKLVVAFRDAGDSDYGNYVVGTISGTDLTFGTQTRFEADNTNKITLSYNSTEQVTFIGYNDVGNSQRLTGISLQNSATNVADFVGITDEAIANAATGSVVVEGGVITNSTLVPFSVSSVGTPVVFNAGNTSYGCAAYDSSNNKVVIAYKDNDNSGYGTAIVGTVSGTSISFGSEVVFSAATTDWIGIAFDSSNNKVVITYRDTTASNAVAIVGTVSGTSISFGSPTTYDSGNGNYNRVAYDSNAQKLVVAYQAISNSNYATAIVGTVSGTSISFGSSVVYESATTYHTDVAYDSDSQKVICTCKDSGNSNKGTAIVGTVSGTSISFGSPAVFSTGGADSGRVAYDATAQKVVVVYRDEANSYSGAANVGTVSGTSISFGATVNFTNSVGADYPVVEYDPSGGGVVVTYTDGGNGNIGKALFGTVSGTSISFTDAITYESSATYFTGSVYDANAQKMVGISKDGGNSNYGTAAVLTTSASLTTGSTYYVQDDGSLSTTSSSVTAGKALSSTTLLLKG